MIGDGTLSESRTVKSDAQARTHPPQNLPIARTITPPSMERTNQRYIIVAL
jgi:hypothetical protein